ncbi:MAG: hypothetical protein EON54_05805 [Alcaligenaceae bacterium]|nr:MAG: hypothetical protein EON54_05805 [Alcaligenaceae bacterium]
MLTTDRLKMDNPPAKAWSGRGRAAATGGALLLALLISGCNQTDDRLLPGAQAAMLQVDLRRDAGAVVGTIHNGSEMVLTRARVKCQNFGEIFKALEFEGSVEPKSEMVPLDAEALLPGATLTVYLEAPEDLLMCSLVEARGRAKRFYEFS